MDIKEYHNNPALSSSKIRQMLKSSAHYEYALLNKIKPTEAMILGDAIHAFILETNRFNEMYDEVADLYLRKTGEHEVGDPKLDADGDPIIMLKDRANTGLDIKGEQYKKFACMREAIKKSNIIREMMLSSTHIEYTIMSNIMGMDVKCRPDTLSVDDGIIWDVKTVGGVGDRPSDNFIRDMLEFGYDVQAALYKRLCEEHFKREFEFRFMCIDVKKDVCGIKEWKMSDELIELGERRLKWCLEQIKKYNLNRFAAVYETPREELQADYKCLELLEKFRGEE